MYGGPQMTPTSWVLFDTETTGLAAPIYVVEIAAQRMRGWEPEGAPFQRLLNQNAVIPPEAARLHGYTREILERDGEDAGKVYRDFAAYVGQRPLVSYNLAYDLDAVLIPEWQRLGIPVISQRGFCALRLAQRLLDPVPAGNCKLQTLRQFYYLPERGAHTALGDVQTVVDLLGQVLRPIAAQRGLHTWDALRDYSDAVWFPSRIAFGKFKDRNFQEARTDADLRGWLEWLAASKNTRSATIGRWYLQELDRLPPDEPENGPSTPSATRKASGGLVVFIDPETEELRRLVHAARERLADLEAAYTRERHSVEVMQSRLFERLQELYQRRDALRLIVQYRRKYLDLLLLQGEDVAEEVTSEYAKAKEQADSAYQQAAEQAKTQQALTEEESGELQTLWRKLVKLFHPDRYTHQPDKQKAYESLVSEVNRARDAADLHTLRSIAEDPEEFMQRHKLGSLDFSEVTQAKSLRRLLESLQIRILSVLEMLTDLQKSSEFALARDIEKYPGQLDILVEEIRSALDQEIVTLTGEAQALADEIAMLTGSEALGSS
jgi:DNA polymerase III epsilon subunit-like protein